MEFTGPVNTYLYEEKNFPTNKIFYEGYGKVIEFKFLYL